MDAQGTLRSFVLAKAKKAKSTEDLLSGLQSLGQGFPSGPETADFAQQLFARAPRPQQANVRTCQCASTSLSAYNRVARS